MLLLTPWTGYWQHCQQDDVNDVNSRTLGTYDIPAAWECAVCPTCKEPSDSDSSPSRTFWKVFNEKSIKLSCSWIWGSVQFQKNTQVWVLTWWGRALPSRAYASRCAWRCSCPRAGWTARNPPSSTFSGSLESAGRPLFQRWCSSNAVEALSSSELEEKRSDGDLGVDGLESRDYQCLQCRENTLQRDSRSEWLLFSENLGVKRKISCMIFDFQILQAEL